MKRAAIVLVSFLTAGFLISCGTRGSTATSTVSHIKVRALVSNTHSGVLDIINAGNDTQPFITIPSASTLGGLGLGPTFMVLSADKKTMLVYLSQENGVALVDTATEAQTARMHLPDWTESLVMSPDAKTAWAAVRNATASGQPTPGAIEILDLNAGVLKAAVPLPLVHFVALNHAGTKLLAFSDQSDVVFVMDTASNTISPGISGFSRPVGAIFSTDDSKAFVLSCGFECGGSAPANVRVLDMTAATPTPGAVTNVSVPATTALLNGTTLFVAGTAPASGSTPATGVLSVVDTNTMNVTKSVTIGDGFHTLMSLTDNNKLFIGARNCTNNTAVENSGCLSIFDTSAQTATVPAPNCSVTSNLVLTCGDVTGVQPITGRSVVYVVQGGELVIYDATTNQLAPTQIDIVGQVGDVKLVD